MLKAKFSQIAAANGTGFIPYIVAGHPSQRLFFEALCLLDELGADMIEVGVPFSDPIAEGEVIERAHHAALAAGFKLADALSEIKKFRARSDTPLVMMGYANSFFNPKLSEVSAQFVGAGANGCLIVDLPYTERAAFAEIERAGLENIQLIAPTSTDETVRGALQNSPSLIYYITQRGVTGASNMAACEVVENLARIKALVDIPVVTGFGIKTAEQVKKLRDYADGIVIGSAIVERLDESDPLGELKAYLAPIVEAIKA